MCNYDRQCEQLQFWQLLSYILYVKTNEMTEGSKCFTTCKDAKN